MPCHTFSPCTHAFTWHTQHKFKLSTLVHIQTQVPSTHTHILRHIYCITLTHSHIHRYVSLYVYRQTFTPFTPSRHTDTHHKRILIFSLLSCIHRGKSVQHTLHNTYSTDTDITEVLQSFAYTQLTHPYAQIQSSCSHTFTHYACTLSTLRSTL